MPTWIDQHCHLDGELEALDALVADAVGSGIVGLIDVGCDLAGSTAAIERAHLFDGVWATAGVHPHEAAGGIDGIAALLDDPAVVAVGECGLDYHYMHSPAADQREVFARQIALANAHDLALVVHTREAWDDTFDILVAEGVPNRTVIHCFSGGPSEARRALDLGTMLSFSGIVTFPSAEEVRAAVVVCPTDRLLVETDAPYLAPVPHRGRPNRPALVAVVGAAVADARGVDLEELAATTVANTRELYLIGNGPELARRAG